MKYNNKKCTFGNLKFDSIKEKDRYIELLAKSQKGEITDLILQPEFELQEAFDVPVLSSVGKPKKKRERAIKYVADFQYSEKIGDKTWDVVEDVKGMKTQVYRLKRKMFLYKYPEYLFRET